MEQIFQEFSEILTVLAFLITLAYAVWSSNREGLSPTTMYWFGVWGVLGALLGGHLLNVINKPFGLYENPWVLVDILGGGKGVFGAFTGGAIFGWFFLRIRNIPVMVYADVLVPAVAIGYATTRIGCFFNGDDFGTVTNLIWAVQFPSGTDAFAAHLDRGFINSGDSMSLPVHPTQLYHAGVGFIGFFVLRSWKSKWQGHRIAIALIGYGITRFFIQFLRDDHGPMLLALDQAQYFSLFFIAGGALLWFSKGRNTLRATENSIKVSIKRNEQNHNLNRA